MRCKLVEGTKENLKATVQSLGVRGKMDLKPVIATVQDVIDNIRENGDKALLAYTEKFGTQQCVNAVKVAIMDKFHAVIDESVIEDVFRNGTADISKEWLDVIRETVKEYVTKLYAILKRYEYEPDLMKLYIVGGGGCLIKNFVNYDRNRVIINDDICATVKGYESWAEHLLKKAESGEH